MSKRISHSLLDPWIAPWAPRLYRLLRIPKRFPPEGIVLVGHLLAIVGAVGFAWSTQQWWGGLLAAAGVAGNHFCDMIDGAHARQTNQCRNGGELLDHFTDPLSFCYWVIGLCLSLNDRLLGLSLALAGVMILSATALLTSIKAKLVGRFELARFGPTEFKALLTLYAVGLTVFVMCTDASSWAFHPANAALGFYLVLLTVGAIQLPVNLVRAVYEVNRSAVAADDSEWELKK